MPNPGCLRLELIDVLGSRLQEKADIVLRHQTLSQQVVLRRADASKRITIRNLHGVPEGVYRLEIDPPSYLPVNRFVNIKASGVTNKIITFPVDTRKVVRVDFPSYSTLAAGHNLLTSSNRVLGFEGLAGGELYDALDDIRRAGLLNILAKCGRTRLLDGSTVLESLLELTELRGDRFFVRVPHSLRESVKNGTAAGHFDEVNGFLHHPPDGFSHAGSYKTPDGYGNLQLTFFSNGAAWVADVDIDDANGFEHIFQVLRNFVTGRPTHPYDIQQILIRHQELDPGYRLVLYA